MALSHGTPVHSPRGRWRPASFLKSVLLGTLVISGPMAAATAQETNSAAPAVVVPAKTPAELLRPFAGKTVNLILVAGQSNAVGYDCHPADLPANPADKDILFWWRCGDPPPDEHDSTSGEQWTYLQHQPRGNPITVKASRQFGNFADPNGGFGPEMGLARALEGNEQETPFAIVKVAYNGTALGRDWNPTNPGSRGSCYRALVSETKAAIAAAKAQDVTMRLQALVWVQGESDANHGAAPVYEKSLTAMIASLRQDLDAPHLLVLMALNTHFGGGKSTYVPEIVKAQQAIAAQDPLCAYVDTSSAPVINRAHYSSEGSLEVGKLFGETLLKMQSSQKSPAAKE